MATLLGKLAAVAATRWRRSLAIVALVLVAIGAAAQAADGTFADEFSAPGTESQRALDLLSSRFPAQAGDTAQVVFFVDRGTLRDRTRAGAVRATVRAIADLPHVSAASDPFAPRSRGSVSRDGRIALSTVQYDRPAEDLGPEADRELAESTQIAERAGVQVARRGQVVDVAERQQAPVGELIGVAVAVLVLTLVFRSVAAMLLTLLSAGVALAGGLMLLVFASAFVDFPSFAPTLGLMLGLGAGIDYALLIVGRYREQLADGDTVAHAARVANQTAGASVVAAGAIVVVAIAGLLATGVPFVGRMGVGSAVVVAAVAVGAVTVLPALMGGFARRLRPKNPKHVAPSQGFARWDRQLTERPWSAALAGLLVLCVLAAPLFDLRLGHPDDGNDADGSTTRVAYDKLAEGFGPGINGPLLLAVRLPDRSDGRAALARTRAALQRTDGVAAVSPPQISPRGDAATITVIPTFSPQDERTSELVRDLRTEVLPGVERTAGMEVYVGGITAVFEDLAHQIAASLPVFIALVVGLSVILLMAIFRSVWVPLVSAGFNLFSIAAAYGVVVAVFQWGWGASLVGIESGIPIVSFVPLFMFAVLFGLSMDYNVFLQSRIREEYFRGLEPADSIVVGLARVARVILAAGVIMASVFLGFVLEPDVVVKTIGFGLAVAILIDVTIVRMVVAPAVMALLGHRAWGLPRWLDRLLPELSLEGVPEPPEAAAPLASSACEAGGAHGSGSFATGEAGCAPGAERDPSGGGPDGSSGSVVEAPRGVKPRPERS